MTNKLEQVKKLGTAYRGGHVTQNEALTKLVGWGWSALQASQVVRAWNDQMELVEEYRAKNKVA